MVDHAAESSSAAEDLAAFAELGDALVDAVRRALPAWVEACVAERSAPAIAAPGISSAAVDEAGRAASSDIGDRLRELFSKDIDEQLTTPLSILRAAVTYPTALLAAAGVAALARDDFATRMFPHDPYDLSPAGFADFGPEVAECGLAWGAAKAFVHLRRRGEQP
ncbi:MAG: hypothetical protein OEU32_13210 [Acidimicrobiia bacterium]|nr:hypothetical protein [Acidimicrobiia bacterium]